VELITQENDRVGFVGIGYMGRPIARRLLNPGSSWQRTTGTTVRQRT